MSALCAALAVGTDLGILAARHPNTWFSNFLTVVSVAGYAVPVFWLGLMLLVLFTSIIPIAPVGETADVRERTRIPGRGSLISPITWFFLC